MNAYRTAPEDRPLTLEEFERLPEEDGARVELVRGRVVREPRPAAEHGRVLLNLSFLLRDHLRHRLDGFAFADTGVILSHDPPTVRGPDLCFVSAARLPDGPPSEGFLDLAPDLCVEIVSPANTATEIQEKVLEYLDAGTRLVWVVDPRMRTVTEHRLSDRSLLLRESEVLDGGEVLSGFSVPVAELFAL